MRSLPFATATISVLLITGCQQSSDAPDQQIKAQSISAVGQYNQDIDVLQNGAISAGAQRVFPVGFYYVPYALISDNTGDAIILNELATMKSDGYNVVHYSPRNEEVRERNFIKTYLSSADDSQTMRVMLGSPFYHSPDDTCTYQTSGFNNLDAATSVNYLTEYQSQNSFLSYTLADDAFRPDAATSNCTSDNLQARVTTLNQRMTSGTASAPAYAQAPNQITGSAIDKKKLYYITGYTSWWNYSDRTILQNNQIVRNPAFFNAWEYYRKLFSNANAIGLQSHSALNDGQSDVVYYITRQGVEIAEAGEDFAAYTSAQQAALTSPLKGYSDVYYGPNARNRSIWAEPGIVAEGLGTNTSKIGVEAWLAIAAGAKGLLWYAYRDTTGRADATFLNKTKAVLTDLKLTLSTVGELNTIFLEGTRKYAFNNSAHVYGTSWDFGGRSYLLAVNTAAAPASGNDSQLVFRVNRPAGSQLSVLPTLSAPRATTAAYTFAPYTDPRGIVLTGTLPAQSATLLVLQ